jgi:DNA-binding NarL/FixJ family response regulator
MRNACSARVPLADDHADLLAAATGVLEPEFEIAATVSDGQAVLGEASRLEPDLLVLDIGMPLLNRIEAARQLRAAGSLAKTVFLTVHDDGDSVRAAQAAIALGYVVESGLASDLCLAAREAFAGRSLVSPCISD